MGPPPHRFCSRGGQYCWKCEVTSGLTPAFGSRIFCRVLSELVQAGLSLGFLCSGPLGQWCGTGGGGGGGNGELEGPRSEAWSGSPGQITLGRLQITERLFINF